MNSIKSSAKKVIEEPNKTQEIQPHDFEKAKNALKIFSKGIPLSTDLPTVDTEGGLFGWFDHKVTGSELNNVTDKVQRFLTATNKQLIGVIQEFGQVYQTFEALDKDYIPWLVAGNKAAQASSNQATKAAAKAFEAAEKAKKNTIDIDSLIKCQANMIEKLIEFKKRIEKIPHIDEVSTMWKDVQDFKSKIQSIRDSIDRSEIYVNETTKLINAQELIVKKIVIFKEEFEAIPHIRDLKIVWDDIHNLTNQILTMSDAITVNEATINERFVAQEQQIAKQNEELVSLIGKNMVALSEKLTNVNKNLTEQNRGFTTHIETIQNGIRKNEETINERFVAQEQQIAKQNDELVLLINNNRADQSKELNDVNKKQTELYREFTTNIETIQNGIRKNEATTNERFVELNTQLLKKIKIAYVVAGTFGAITVTHIVLAVLGIV